MKIIALGTLALAPFSFFTPSAQAEILEGQIFERGTRDGVSNIDVIILPSKIRITTDRLGQFQTPDLNPGEYQIIVNAQGFQKEERKIQVPYQQKLKISILPFKKDLFETEVVSNEKKDPAKQTLSRKKAASLPGAGFDPLRAVQNLPGVNRGQGFSSQVVIQGSAPQDTVYQIDGHEIPIIFHFGGLSSVFMPELTESYDFLAAGYQSQYSRAMGGIINLNSKNLDTERTRGMAFFDIFNAGGQIETKVSDTGRLSIGARTSYIGPVLKKIAEGNDDFNLTVAPTFSDLSLVYTDRFTDRTRFKIVGIGSSDELKFVLSEPVNQDPELRGNFSTRIGFFRIIPQVEHDHEDGSKSKFSLGFGRDFIFNSIGDYDFTLKTYALTTRGEHQRKITETWNTSIGFDHRYSWADVSFTLPQFNATGGVLDPLSVGDLRTADLKDVETHSLGLFTHNIWKPQADSRLTLMPGFRLDYFKPIKSFGPSPRLSGRFDQTSTFAWTAGGGLYFQPPEEAEYSPEYGNPSLRPPRAWHFRAGYEKDLSESLSKGAQYKGGVFGRWFDQLVINDIRTAYSNNGRGRAIGLEQSLQFKTEWLGLPWDLWLAYTLSRSTRWDPSNPEYLYRFDQTHLMTLIWGVDLPRNWRISSRIRYVTGPLETVPTGSRLDTDNDVFIPVRGSLYNERLNPFFQVDLRVDKRWVYETWTLSFYIDILNALNRKNTEAFSFSYDFRTRETVTGIPILPTIGLKGEF